MPDWKSFEACHRLLTAIFAAYDLKPGGNLQKIAAYYGTEATAFAIQHHLRKIKEEADKMKLQDNSDGEQAPTTTKPAKSRTSAKKPDRIMKGRVKKTTASAKKRMVKMEGTPEMVTVEEEDATGGEEQLDEIHGSEVLLKDEPDKLGGNALEFKEWVKYS